MDIVTKTSKLSQINLGLHMHNDSACAVCNSILPVQLDSNLIIQGTINGYGERCGNADLCSIIPNLVLKQNIKSKVKIYNLTSVSEKISKIVNISNNRNPYVGSYAFSHKAGTHVNSVMKNPSSYEHINPSLVGNKRDIIVSEASGISNIIYRGRLLGYEEAQIKTVSQKILELVKVSKIILQF